MASGVLGTLFRGLSSQCRSSTSVLQQLPAVAAAASCAMPGQWVVSQVPHAAACAMHQPQAGCRSLSFLSAAAAQQHSAGLVLPAAGPLQQLLHPRCLLPNLWQPQQQNQQQLPRQQQQQQHPQFPALSGQVRHFVLMPRRVKYRKAHKSMGFNETICGNTRQLAFGLYGIRALEHCRIPASTLEAVRRTLRRTIKKTTMLWIRVTPNVPVTSKPAEVRMGKGKGTLDYWAAPIRPGQIIFEMDRCSRATAMQAVQAIKAKMPIKVDFVEWN